MNIEVLYFLNARTTRRLWKRRSLRSWRRLRSRAITARKKEAQYGAALG
jgi:hypothetical protein